MMDGSPCDVSGHYDFVEHDMKESGSIEPCDRLSNLPNCIIHEIFSYMPMRNVVKTTILSKQWKDIWTTAHTLNFDALEDGTCSSSDFVSGALKSWKGKKLRKLRIVTSIKTSNARDLNSWLAFAIAHSVEELDLDLVDHNDYWAPEFLYSCLSIRKLTLVACNLPIVRNVQWDHLKSLRIEGVYLGEDVLNVILSGTPRLEFLMLRIMDSDGNLNIHSSSLKKLKIEKYIDVSPVVSAETVTTLRIWTPQAETLEILGLKYSHCLLLDVSSLANVALGFYATNKFMFSQSDEAILRQVYRSIQHVKKVTLSLWCTQVLESLKKKSLLSSPFDATFLKIYHDDGRTIVDLLEMFPKLTVLDIKYGGPMLMLRLNNLKLEKILLERGLYRGNPSMSKIFPECYLQHLRTVEITWIAPDTQIYHCVEILLRHARMLEKMALCPSLRKSATPLTPESWLLVAQKLLHMPRSSPTVKVVLCDCMLRDSQAEFPTRGCCAISRK